MCALKFHMCAHSFVQIYDHLSFTTDPFLGEKGSDDGSDLGDSEAEASESEVDSEVALLENILS